MPGCFAQVRRSRRHWQGLAHLLPNGEHTRAQICACPNLLLLAQNTIASWCLLHPHGGRLPADVQLSAAALLLHFPRFTFRLVTAAASIGIWHSRAQSRVERSQAVAELLCRWSEAVQSCTAQKISCSDCSGGSRQCCMARRARILWAHAALRHLDSYRFFFLFFLSPSHFLRRLSTDCCELLLEACVLRAMWALPAEWQAVLRGHPQTSELLAPPARLLRIFRDRGTSNQSLSRGSLLLLLRLVK